MKKLQEAASLRQRITSSYLTLAFGVIVSFSYSGFFNLTITLRNITWQYHQAQNNIWAMTVIKTLVILLFYWLFYSQIYSVAQCLMFPGTSSYLIFYCWNRALQCPVNTLYCLLVRAKYSLDNIILKIITIN